MEATMGEWALSDATIPRSSGGEAAGGHDMVPSGPALCLRMAGPSVQRSSRCTLHTFWSQQ